MTSNELEIMVFLFSGDGGSRTRVQAYRHPDLYVYIQTI